MQGAPYYPNKSSAGQIEQNRRNPLAECHDRITAPECCGGIVPRPKNSEVEDLLYSLGNSIDSLEKALAELKERIQSVCVFSPQLKDPCNDKEPPQPTKCAVANVIECKINQLTYLDKQVQELLNSIRL